ncbi:uncharacterized protein [Hemitrygon akajei]|uniref:uncharacterized protein n=1 Tax=Hemitrygon akajei TaxID=2704970 RepID=UPI003BF9591E
MNYNSRRPSQLGKICHGHGAEEEGYGQVQISTRPIVAQTYFCSLLLVAEMPVDQMRAHTIISQDERQSVLQTDKGNVNLVFPTSKQTDEQSHSLQSHVTSQFVELRQIITEKEQSLLRDLREEEKRILNSMEKNLREIQENIRFIQEEISKLKEQMDQKDSVMFLKEEARRNRRINDDVQELSVTDETLPVEKFDHLYLLNTVLRETLDAINREGL